MATVTRNIKLANPASRSAGRGKRSGIGRVRSTAAKVKRAAKRAVRAGRNKAGQFVRKAKSATKSFRRKVSMTAKARPAKRTTTRRSNPAHILTLGLLGANPARKSGKKKVSNSTMATRKRKRTRAAAPKRRRRRVVAAPKRRRRVNPAPARRRRRRRVASAAPVRRRRRSNPTRSAAPRRRRRVNSRRRRVASYRRRNPSVFGTNILSTGGIKLIGGGLVGFALTKMIMGRFVPAQLRVGGFVGDVAIKAAIAYGLGMVTGRFLGKDLGQGIMFGGLMSAGSSLLDGVAPGLRVMDTPLSLNGMGYWADARFTVPQNPITAGMAASVAPPAPANINLSGMSRAFGHSF